MSENESVIPQNQVGTSLVQKQKQSLIATMAEKYGIGSDQFFNVIQQTIMPGGATKEQTAAFLIVCNRYGFDPFLRQIYAFPSKGGGIIPVVSIDGWLDIMNSNPNFEGDEYKEIWSEDGKKLIGATVTIYVRGRKFPTIHSEYFDEIKRNTDPWNNMPRRMTKNRTYVQGIRRAFGVAGIMDPEEAEQMKEINVTSQSTEISRSTEVATVDLKEKISRSIQTVKDKREAAKKVAEATPAAPTPPVEVEAPPPVIVPLSNKPQSQTVDTKTGEVKDDGLPFDENIDDLVGGGVVDPDAFITDVERSDFLALMKAAPGETTVKQIAIKQKLVSMGYTNTKEIRYRHYQELLDWAKSTRF